ncbi:hypothetical protein Sked_20570 [Sanguibacter keddieii DSM 10542]|uniref:Uncharacterized protein n=1 Tax=Sanguibacter keddieii (strain ATCC 51767 / DSM 10542 / NCFB 3025 / ST-74) TaxID=446469 RepID=D1BHQ9_SANKS|nr:hypothetical protein Sked_20570 [Sanguibacter keddieii DSM 10542]
MVRAAAGTVVAPRANRTWKSATRTVLRTSSTEIITDGTLVCSATHSGSPTVCSPKCTAKTLVRPTATRYCGSRKGERPGETVEPVSGSSGAGPAVRRAAELRASRTSGTAPVAATQPTTRTLTRYATGVSTSSAAAATQVPTPIPTLTTTCRRARISTLDGPVKDRATSADRADAPACRVPVARQATATKAATPSTTENAASDSPCATTHSVSRRSAPTRSARNPAHSDVSTPTAPAAVRPSPTVTTGIPIARVKSRADTA